MEHCAGGTTQVAQGLRRRDWRSRHIPEGITVLRLCRSADRRRGRARYAPGGRGHSLTPRVPTGTALHWKDHVKTFSRRQFVTTKLSELKQLSVLYVMIDKAAIPPGAAMLGDQVVFYNYAAGFVLERALLAARQWPGGQRDAVIRFGHVRGFNHMSTKNYFVRKQQAPTTANLPWECLRSIHFDDQTAWDGLQVADQYAGMLHAAFRPDEFGGYESAHLLTVRHQLRRSSTGEAWGWGFKFLGVPQTVQRMPWWPQSGL